MSGGVDSSVTAKLIAEQDYDVSAVYMRNWDTRDESGTDKGCEWEKDWEDVQRVCKLLDIPCQLLCRPQLLRATDETKDQTYFLAGISEKGLRRALFPLGNLLKSEVREIAKRHRLPTAERKESMAEADPSTASYIPPNPGPIIDVSTGSTIAMHQGLWNYTIGQGARIPGMKQKAFVVRKDIEQNTVYIAPGADNPLLLCSAIDVRHFSFIWADSPPAGLQEPTGYRAHVKLMHRMKLVMSSVFGSPGTNQVTVKFDEPLSGISPGQVAIEPPVSELETPQPTKTDELPTAPAVQQQQTSTTSSKPTPQASSENDTSPPRTQLGAPSSLKPTQVPTKGTKNVKDVQIDENAPWHGVVVDYAPKKEQGKQLCPALRQISA
ncbi:hypothetical protein C0993_008392 [Termitomyces sp. T159_Od127]|nr:hypothetical protein C0993_008392 [Termitomyces sp. T159_Od127]